jgi:cyanophycinase-like exopeptidase
LSRGSVYLIGSMDRTSGGTMIERALDGAGPSAKIAVSFAPVAENPEALKHMGDRMLKLFSGKGTVTRFSLPGEADADPARARSIIAEADLIFLSGGDPVLGARIFRESGADAWLREARERGAATAGISAGAIMLGAWWASWPDEPDEAEPFHGGTLIHCTGVVGDLVVDCHAEEDDWSELKLVAEMLRAKGDGARLRGVPTRGGLIVGPDNSLGIVGDEAFAP